MRGITPELLAGDGVSVRTEIFTARTVMQQAGSDPYTGGSIMAGSMTSGLGMDMAGSGFKMVMTEGKGIIRLRGSGSRR